MNQRDKWLEDLDDLINRSQDLGLPELVVENIIERLDEVVDQVGEQFNLRSADWK